MIAAFEAETFPRTVMLWVILPVVLFSGSAFTTKLELLGYSVLASSKQP